MLNKGITRIIEDLLARVPALRDSDSKLVATIWNKQIPENLSKLEVLRYIADKKVMSSESIRRTRQLLQSQNPSLRGENWKKRHAHEQTVKSEIKDMKTFASGQETFELFEGVRESLKTLTIKKEV